MPMTNVFGINYGEVSLVLSNVLGLIVQPDPGYITNRTILISQRHSPIAQTETIRIVPNEWSSLPNVNPIEGQTLVFDEPRLVWQTNRTTYIWQSNQWHKMWIQPSTLPTTNWATYDRVYNALWMAKEDTSNKVNSSQTNIPFLSFPKIGVTTDGRTVLEFR